MYMYVCMYVCMSYILVSFSLSKQKFCFNEIFKAANWKSRKNHFNANVCLPVIWNCDFNFDGLFFKNKTKIKFKKNNFFLTGIRVGVVIGHIFIIIFFFLIMTCLLAKSWTLQKHEHFSVHIDIHNITYIIGHCNPLVRITI